MSSWIRPQQPAQATGVDHRDRVFIEQLRIDAEIGINPDEHGRSQALLLDIELAFDNTRPAASDAIADTVDYAAVCTRLQQHVTARRWNLLETLAESCATLLRMEFGVQQLRLKISKPEAVPAARAVGVIIERNG
jgi:7,8-dihydroneopterin aldolase/epimerase/oxygenase